MTTLIKFAEELKLKRESLGISVNEIYEKTRIDKKYIEEMEKGNFAIMPDVYMRAFIRKYADAINCNVEETIKRYEAACKGENFEETEVNELNKNSKISTFQIRDIDNFVENQNSIEKEEKKINPILALIFALIIIIAGIIYFTVLNPNSVEIIVEPKVEDIIEQQNGIKETPRFEVVTNEDETKSSLDVANPKNDSLSLKINALDSSWFRIQIDNTKKDEFILAPKRSKTLFAKSQIDLLIGNAGGIEFILNGKKLEFDGKKGEIRNVIVDLQGIHYSKTQQDLGNE